MSANIYQMVDNDGNKQYPVTSTEAIGMSGGSGNLKDYLNKSTTEFNVSASFPTGGTSGSNKYDLASAIGKVPAELRTDGLTVSFLNESEYTEKWEYLGSGWAVRNFRQMGIKLKLDTEVELLHLNADNIQESVYRVKVTSQQNLTYYLFSRCTNPTADCIIVYDTNNNKLASTTQGYGTGGYYTRELTTPENTAFVEFVFTPNKLTYDSWNIHNIPRAWVMASDVANIYHSKISDIDSCVGYIKNNRDIIISEHTTDSANSTYFLSEFYDCSEGMTVSVQTFEQSAQDVIQFYNAEESLLDKVTCGGGGGYKTYTKVAPTGTTLVKVGYHYNNKYRGIAKFVDYPIVVTSFKNTEEIKALKDEQNNNLSYDDIKEVFTIETDSDDIQNSTTVYPCIENTEVKVLSHHQSPIANITFCSDLFGEIGIGESIMGDGSGGYKERNGVAPEGTRSVKIMATYKKDKPLVITS